MRPRAVVITGAGHGIGASTARAFAEQGDRVVLADLDEDAVTALAAELDAVAVVADLSTTAGAEAVAAAAVDTYDRVDVLVNNAAAYRTGPLHTCDDDDWEATMSGVLGPVFRTTRAVLPAMLAAGSGVIVNIASVHQLVAAPEHAAYTAAKGGVAALSRQLAVEYGPRGIRCNCVSPGLVVTRERDHGSDTTGDRQVGGGPLSVDPLADEPYPLGRLGKPEDVAAAVVFLASDGASFITGVDLPVDGGLTVLHPGAAVSTGLRARWGRPPLHSQPTD